MTSAARPTWNPAKGGTHQGGNRLHAPTLQTSAKDQPGHTELKLRKPGQGAPSELRAKDLKADLEEREKKHFEAKGGKRKEEEEEEEEEEKKLRPKLLEYKEESKNVDADDSDSSEDEDESSGEEDSEDETLELMRELEKIKKEREEEKRKQEEEKERLEAERRDEEVKFGNPLLAKGEGNFNVKKRWFEDVVFKNQAKDEPQRKKRFINDTIRNDFHKKFLSKYIQ